MNGICLRRVLCGMSLAVLLTGVAEARQIERQIERRGPQRSCPLPRVADIDTLTFTLGEEDATDVTLTLSRTRGDQADFGQVGFEVLQIVRRDAYFASTCVTHEDVEFAGCPTARAVQIGGAGVQCYDPAATCTTAINAGFDGCYQFECFMNDEECLNRFRDNSYRALTGPLDPADVAYSTEGFVNADWMLNDFAVTGMCGDRDDCLLLGNFFGDENIPIGETGSASARITGLERNVPYLIVGTWDFLSGDCTDNNCDVQIDILIDTDEVDGGGDDECEDLDADGDGEADATDRCPDTAEGAAVDDSGCSQAQFCSAVDVTGRSGRLTCLFSDWMNDEAIRFPRDCRLDRPRRPTSCLSR